MSDSIFEADWGVNCFPIPQYDLMSLPGPGVTLCEFQQLSESREHAEKRKSGKSEQRGKILEKTSMIDLFFNLSLNSKDYAYFCKKVNNIFEFGPKLKIKSVPYLVIPDVQSLPEESTIKSP